MDVGIVISTLILFFVVGLILNEQYKQHKMIVAIQKRLNDLEGDGK
jgi:hypothetical protein